jgi:hypothetical protein
MAVQAVQPMAVQSYAPMAMQSVAPMAIQSVAPMAIQSVAPSFGLQAAAPFAVQPMALQSFAPMALPSVAPTFSLQAAAPMGLQAAPAFSLSLPVNVTPATAPPAPQSAASAQGTGGTGGTDMRLDDALRKISTSLDSLRQIADIHTSVLADQKRRLDILDEATKDFANNPAQYGKDFAASLKKANDLHPANK